MSKIVSIHSYRGGTRKSNSTANLAAVVASYGYQVAVVDTDIQSPGIHILFGYGDAQKLDSCLIQYLEENYYRRLRNNQASYHHQTVDCAHRKPPRLTWRDRLCRG